MKPTLQSFLQRDLKSSHFRFQHLFGFCISH